MTNHTHYILKAFALVLLLFIAWGCSTTSHLPEDEVLYTGIKSVKIEGEKGTYDESVALDEVEAAIAYAPNAAFMGSSFVRSPFPIGLWVYNAFVNKPRTVFNKWIFNSFSTTPITIANVNPVTRAKVATNLLQNYGYFHGNVDYELVNQRNPRKQKINYNITLGEPYLLGNIEYRFPAIQDSIINATKRNTYLHTGDQFSTLNLTSEKTRLVNAFRDNGYYYYRPDYINYFADSVNTPQQVQLRVIPDADIPEKALRQYHIGNMSAYIRNGSYTLNRNSSRTTSAGSKTTAVKNVTSGSNSTSGTNATTAQRQQAAARLNQYDDSLMLQGLKIAYQGKQMPIKPRVMFKNFKFWTGRMFNQSNVDNTITNLNNMDVFSSVKFAFTPRDTSSTCDTLDVRLDVTLDKPIDTELNFNITQKSNSQIGPNLGIIFSKRNAFRHGETLSLGLRGSYEWQTQKLTGENKRIDSYEAGIDASLTYPWIAFPWLNKKIYKYPTSSTFKVSLDELNRSSYYRLMSFMVHADYAFQTARSWNHVFTPITISYNKMQHTSERFNSIVSENSALYISLRDQFIPAMQYSLVIDDSWNDHLRHKTRFSATVKESGNLLNFTNGLLGHGYNVKDKRLLFATYSQFLKLNLELKNNFRISKKTEVATRMQVGTIWTYGNSTIAPYSELFYVGGANSIRAFAVRSIGPGSYYDRTGRGTYLDQSGDIKIEFNSEYRFPIVNTLYGAFFIDAGNVWLMRKDDTRPGGEITSGDFLNSIAVGTGFGLRYDLEFLILRLDLGVGIHAPYDTGKRGYYNIRKFSDGLGFHFAVGYPF